MKVCNTCERELNKESFYKNKAAKDGLQKKCKDCVKEYARENDERIKTYQKNWRQEHKEETKEYNFNYRKSNKIELNEKKKIYYKNTIETRKKHFKKYYKGNRKYFIEKQKEYYRNNREDILEYTKAWRKKYYEENKEKVLNQYKRYRQTDKYKKRAVINQQKRRALKEGLESSLTEKEWGEAIKYFDYKCAYCGKEKKLTQDHFIPLTKGGEYSRNNIIPACSNCNSQKYNSDFFEWFSSSKHYSKKRKTKILDFLNYSQNEYQQLTLL